MTVKYERVVNALYGTIEEGFEDRFAEVANRLDKAVTAVQARFFKKLVMKAIDKKAAPNLGDNTPVWKPLSGKYLEKKKKLGQSSGFYMQTGELKSALSSLNAKTTLGKPLVLFTPSGFVGRSGVTSRQETWKGSASKRNVIRDSRGRFAKATDIPRYVKASMTVRPYPKILEDATKSVIDESEVFDEDIAGKLKNPNGRRMRPIFTNFLNWFLETEIRKVVEREL